SAALNPDCTVSGGKNAYYDTATTKEETSQHKMIISCEDFGAYSLVTVNGKKSVRLAVRNGEITDQLSGNKAGEDEAMVTVPMDEEPPSDSFAGKNHIADAYERSQECGRDPHADQYPVAK